MAEKSNNDFNARLTEQLLDSNSIGQNMLIAPYSGSSIQKESYNRIEKNDVLYKLFIQKNYGSYENFLMAKKLLQDITIFDPSVDYIIDTTVITKDVSYKTDHLSTQEVINENLSGVCTVYFTKKTTGTVRRLQCTLNENLVPNSQSAIRSNFFSAGRGDLVGVWDINIQAWRSFYMSSVIKFIRDDTTSIE
jgi:hypothetical protein